jgi:hypothetical protein
MRHLRNWSTQADGYFGHVPESAAGALDAEPIRMARMPGAWLDVEREGPRHVHRATGRLHQVNEVEEWGFQVFRPDSHLAHQIKELADAPCPPDVRSSPLERTAAAARPMPSQPCTASTCLRGWPEGLGYPLVRTRSVCCRNLVHQELGSGAGGPAGSGQEGAWPLLAGCGILAACGLSLAPFSRPRITGGSRIWSSFTRRSSRRSCLLTLSD